MNCVSAVTCLGVVLLAANAKAFFGMGGGAGYDMFGGGGGGYDMYGGAGGAPPPPGAGAGGYYMHGGGGGGYDMYGGAGAGGAPPPPGAGRAPPPPGAGAGGGMGFGMMGMLAGGDFGGGMMGEGMNKMMKMRYDCQMERGTCLDLYVTPGAPGAEPAGGEPAEVEVEAPPAKPAAGGKPGGPHGKPGAHGAPRAGPPMRRPPPPPRRMVPNPMAFIKQHCMSFEWDFMSCPKTGGVCCYQTP